MTYTPTPEAIEAAARELVPGDWKLVPERSMAHYRQDATAALTAAMPYLTAQRLAVPEIPAGWSLDSIDTMGEDLYEACLVQDLLKPYPTPQNDPVWGRGETWQEALAEACKAAEARHD